MPMQSRNVIRDPIYGPIVLDDTAVALIDTAAYQRLRQVRQLSLASFLYPSAMHTRFEHSVGVYHLARTIVRQLAERGELADLGAEDERLIAYAGLLHDTAQHMCAHLLEEFGYQEIGHEKAAAALFTTGELGEILAATGIPDAGRRIAEMVQHQSDHPLAGVVAGACDADKLDYVARDAYHCGLPIGFDQAHLRDSLCVVRHPGTGRREIGLESSGLTSFEQMLYSKSTLYRNVYFHRTVRCAMVMLRALVVAALEARVLELDELHRWADEELFTVLRTRTTCPVDSAGPTALMERLLDRLLSRRLYHCAASTSLADAHPLGPEEVLAAERALAAELGLRPGDALLDIPRKPSMLSTDIHVRCADGRIVHASTLTPDDGFALNEAQDALYAASGRVCVFTAEPRTLAPERLREIMAGVAGSARAG